MTNEAQIVLEGTNAHLRNNFGSPALTCFANNSGVFAIRNGFNLNSSAGFTNSGNLTVGVASNFTRTAGALPNCSSSTAGNFTQNASGSLTVELGGLPSSQFGRLSISGQATLAGTLDVSLVSGFVPARGDSFRIMTYGSRSGAFGLGSGFDLGNGLALKPVYDNTGLTLITNEAGGAGADRTVTIAPAAGQSGTATITVTVTDASGGTATDTFVLTVAAAAGRPPVAQDDAAATDEDVLLTIDVLANDTDADGNLDATSVSIVAGPTSGAVLVNATTGAVTYSPNLNFSGDDAFTYQVCDTTSLCDTAVVTIQVRAVNDAPTLEAIANPAAINEDAAEQTISLAGISAGGGETQTLAITATSDNSGLIPNPTVTYTSSNASGSLAYTPVADQSGSATITVTVRDAGLDGTLGNADDATFSRSFTVQVDAANDAPTLDAIADPAAVNEDAAEQTISLTGISAGGGETQTLAVTAASDNPGLIPNPTVSYTSPDAGGSLAYTPVADQSGLATITVTVRDAGPDGTLGNADDATFSRSFTVQVDAINDAPVNTVPATQDTLEDQAKVLASASLNSMSILDVDADSASVQVTLTASNGEITLGLLSPPAGAISFSIGDGTDDGTMTFTGSMAAINQALDGLKFQPSPDFFGLASISVTTDDLGNSGAGGARSDTDTLLINVTPENDIPTALADSYGVVSGNTLTVSAPGVLGNDSDIDSPTLSAILVTTTTHGLLTLNDDGSFTYIPEPGFGGADSFVYRASDGEGRSEETTVSITVELPPSATVTGPTTAVRGQRVPFTFVATDTVADEAAGFTFTIDWGDGSTQIIGPAPGNGAGTTVEHVYADANTFNIQVIAADQTGLSGAAVQHTIVVKAADIFPDPVAPGGTVLIVGGTAGDDQIVVKSPGGGGNRVIVKVNDAAWPTCSARAAGHAATATSS